MSVLVGVVLLIAGCVLALLGAFAFQPAAAAGRRLWRVVRGDASSLATATRGGEAFHATTVRERGRLAVAVDRFAYWCLRFAADGGNTVFAVVGKRLFASRYGTHERRSGDSRIRHGDVSPSPLRTRSDDRDVAVVLGANAHPRQSLAPTGAFVPCVVSTLAIGSVIAAVVLSWLLPHLLGRAALALAPRPTLLLAVAAIAVVVLVGRRVPAAGSDGEGWDATTTTDEPAAAGTTDPPGTGVRRTKTLAPGDALYVLGTVERRAPDRVVVADGVVTTRGRGFLAALVAGGVVAACARAMALLAPGVAFCWLGLSLAL